MTYASFWKRVAAYFIDIIIYGLIKTAGAIFLAVLLGITGILNHTNTIHGQLQTTLLWMFFTIACFLLYFVWPESSTAQATLGKRIMGLKVTDSAGQRISFWRSLGRNLGMYISGLILGIGYLMCLWTERKQCLHDMLADCIVADTKPEENSGCVVAVVIGVVILLVGTLFFFFFAAIAMPQFFRAVEKARLTEAVTLMENINQAQLRAGLQYDHYVTDFRELDVAPQGAQGNVYYTDLNQQTGKPGNGFEVTLHPHKITAQRITPSANGMNYVLSRYYGSPKTSCTANNESSVFLCADFCGLNKDDLSVGDTCCSNGTAYECDPNDGINFSFEQ